MGDDHVEPLRGASKPPEGGGSQSAPTQRWKGKCTRGSRNERDDAGVVTVPLQ
jgi:hypothetical protein